MLRRRLMGNVARDSNTVSLIHFDGNYKDERGNVWTDNGSIPQIYTGDYKFGSSCWEQDNSAHLTLDTNLPYQDCTIEAWVKFGQLNRSYNWRRIFEIVGCGMYFSNADAGDTSKILYWKPSGYDINIGTDKFPLGTWNHVAIVYDYSNNRATLYINGKKYKNKETVTWNSDKPSTITLGIGSLSTCRMDEFRFSKGQIYTGDFTPPNAPFVIEYL